MYIRLFYKQRKLLNGGTDPSCVLFLSRKNCGQKVHQSVYSKGIKQIIFPFMSYFSFQPVVHNWLIVRKIAVCAILSVGWCILKFLADEVGAGFYPSGLLPYFQCHVTIK